MIDLKIELSTTEIEHIELSKNRKTKLLRIRKLTGLNSKTLYSHIENNCNTVNLIRCGFCDSIRSFKAFEYIFIGNKLYITDIEYDKKIFICSRKDTDKTINCRSKQLNPNSIELIRTAYKFDSDAAANEFLLNRNKSPFYKTNHASTQEYSNAQRRDANFYGSQEKYEQKLKKISTANKKENVIKKHGIEKANEIFKSKDSSSKQHFIEKYGEDWEYFLNLKNKKCSGSLDRFISTHGEIIGEIKYNRFVETARKNTISFMKSLSIEERSMLFGTSSIKYFKNKYGNLWEEKYKNHQQKIQTGGFRASKESLVFFDKLIYKLKNYDIMYHIGIEDNKEWFIYDSERKKFNLYDFCIKELNIIIEYHGSMWHFNPDYEYKRELPFGMNLTEHKTNDLYKRELAEKSGFAYYVVFDTDDKDKKATELSKIILEKLNAKRNV